ncbi:MAG: DUF420 domain-containing protein [Verrucomicrobiae bacterium]|nr:DUF420 domain-containing protein [Verrucomicrobiae bacterium]
MIELTSMPAINASLNALTASLLLVGGILIRLGRKEAHRRVMISAFLTSTVFLACYLYYHFHAKITRFPRSDWAYWLYLSILLPHTLLAMIVLPFIFAAFYHAFRGQFETHKKIVRWVWPVWMYVSVSGVLVYFMLYHWFRPG